MKQYTLRLIDIPAYRSGLLSELLRSDTKLSNFLTRYKSISLFSPGYLKGTNEPTSKQHHKILNI